MPLECDHIRNEFSALLDNELNPEDRELVEEHLSDCSDCLRELHGYKVVSDLYRYHHPVKAPEDFEARFRAAIAPIGRKRTFTWQRWGLVAAAGFTLIAGVAVWQSRSRMAHLDTAEMASHLASDAAPESASPPEGPMALRFSTPDAEGTQATPESAPESIAPAQPGALPMEQTTVAGQRSDEAAPALGDRLNESRNGIVEVLPSVSIETGGGGSPVGGAMPQAAPATEPASGLDENTSYFSVDGADAKSAKQKSASPSPAAAPAPEKPASAEAPARPGIELKVEAPSVQSAPEPVAMKVERAAGSKKEDSVALKAATPTDLTALTWHDLNFRLTEGIWRQEGYSSEALTRISIPSEAWNGLLDHHPDLATLCDRAEPVIVKLDETWYQFMKTSASGGN